MKASKKIVSLVLALLIIITMMSVMSVSSSAVGDEVVISNEDELRTAALNGGSYYIDDDITLTSKVTVSEDMTLDLGGFTVKNSGVVFEVSEGKSFTVSNGIIHNTSDSGYAVRNFGEFELQSDAEIFARGSEGNGIFSGEGSVNYIYGTIDISAWGIYVYRTAKANVYEGAVLTSQDASCLSGNGTVGYGGYEINVYGGTIQSVNDIAIYHPNSGLLWIGGGTITGATAVYVRSGDVEITGGTFKGTGVYTGYSYSAGANATGDAVVIESCNYPGGIPDVNITGGYFESTNSAPIASYAGAKSGDTVPDVIENFVAGGDFNKDISPDLAAGGCFVTYDSETGGYYAAAECLYSVGNRGFQEFADALASVEAGGTIKLVGDGNLNYDNDTAHAVISKNVIIDLGGFTLTTAPVNGANSTTKGKTKYDFIVNNGAEFTLKNGRVNSYNTYFGIYVSDGTVNIASNAVYEGFNETTVLYMSDTGTLNVNGTVISHDYFAIGANDSDSYDYTININSGAVVTADGNNEVAVYQCGDGTLNISGGTITGSTGVMANAGTTNITGGTIAAVGEAKAFAHKTGGPADTGDALLVENCGYPSGKVNVNITGGTFVSAKGKAVSSFGMDADCPAVNNFISGGVFSSNVNDYAKNGVYFSENKAGKYTVNNAENPNKLKAEKFNIEGYQTKAGTTTDEGNNINTHGVRIITKFTNTIGASEYGYVVAKPSDDENVDTLAFSNLTTRVDYSQRINCTGTDNNIPGLGEGYVTLAVNGMKSGERVAARFYAVINGVTYYSDYISTFGNIDGGIIAVMG